MSLHRHAAPTSGNYAWKTTPISRPDNLNAFVTRLDLASLPSSLLNAFITHEAKKRRRIKKARKRIRKHERYARFQGKPEFQVFAALSPARWNRSITHVRIRGYDGVAWKFTKRTRPFYTIQYHNRRMFTDNNIP